MLLFILFIISLPGFIPGVITFNILDSLFGPFNGATKKVAAACILGWNAIVYSMLLLT
jgi:hypothetical protein